MKKLSDEGIFIGTLLIPTIPFITDTEENIKEIVRLSYEHGAKFVFSMGAVTLRDNQREYFYNKLDKHFPGLKEKYIRTYGDSYACYTLNKDLYKIFVEECKKYNLLYKMEDIIKAYKKTKEDIEQLSLL